VAEKEERGLILKLLQASGVHSLTSPPTLNNVFSFASGRADRNPANNGKATSEGTSFIDPDQLLHLSIVEDLDELVGYVGTATILFSFIIVPRRQGQTIDRDPY
jgi:hypothetical protein